MTLFDYYSTINIKYNGQGVKIHRENPDTENTFKKITVAPQSILEPDKYICHCSPCCTFVGLHGNLAVYHNILMRTMRICLLCI